MEQKSFREKLEIQLFICLSNRSINSKQFKQVQKSWSESFIKSDGFSNIKISVIYSDRKSLERKLRFALNIPSPESSIIRDLQKFYVRKLQHVEQIYRLSLPTELDEFVEETINLFEYNFSDRKQKLIIIPCLDKLKADVLSGYYVDEDDSISVSKKAFTTTLEGISGILIQGFSSQHLETIVNQNIQHPNFQFDWIYLGHKRLVVFEVETLRNPDNLVPTIQRLVIGCLSRTAPHVCLILYSFWKSFQQNRRTNINTSFSDVCEEILSHIIYIAGVTYDDFMQAIHTIRESISKSVKTHKKDAATDVILKRNFVKTVELMKPDSRIIFMVYAGSMREPELIQVNCKFEVIRDQRLSGKIFDSLSSPAEELLESLSFPPDEMLESLMGFPPEEMLDSLGSLSETLFASSSEEKLSMQKFLKFATSLLSTASLNFADLESKNRCDISISQWKEMQAKRTFDLKLNKQQREILFEEDRTHLVISGEASVGEKGILIAKSEQLALRSDVDKVILLYDHYGKKLRKYKEYLDECKRNPSIEAETKIDVKRVDEFDRTTFKVESFRTFNSLESSGRTRMRGGIEFLLLS